MTMASKLEWRLMEAGDLASVSSIADIVHPDFPEDDAIFRERLALYPAGCFILSDGRAPHGYCFSHPWSPLAIPALDTLLEKLPEQTQNYYIHDIALLPSARSGGVAKHLVARIADHALRHGFATISLVAVNGSGGFWERQGFAARHVPALESKLRGYSDDAQFMVRDLAEG